MQYLTGTYALNLPCLLETTGDWHTSALNWNNIKLADSKNSIFRDYGIEASKEIPEHKEKYSVANHIRAVLDLLEQKNFSVLGDFKNDFICNDKYTQEIFSKVSLLLPDEEIANFMWKVYGKEWRLWIGELNIKKY